MTAKRAGLLQDLNKNKAFFLMLLPGVIWLLVFKYLPMFGITLAFIDFKLYGKSFINNILRSRWVGLKNFSFLFSTQDAWLITRNTLGYNLVFIILGTLFSVFLAIALNELLNKRTAKFYQTLMFLPYFLSWVVVSYLLFSFLKTEKGFINRLLTAVGGKPVYWYTSPRYWPFILVFTNLWKWSGYSSVIYLAAICGIDKSYYEAARIDGAGKLKQTLFITLPFLKPLIIILSILALGRIFSADFGLFYQVPRDNGVLYPVTNVIDTYVYRGLMQSANIGMTTAAGVYQSICGFILILTSNTLVRRFSAEHALF